MTTSARWVTVLAGALLLQLGGALDSGSLSSKLMRWHSDNATASVTAKLAADSLIQLRQKQHEEMLTFNSSSACKEAPPKRVVFSLTSTASRLARIKPALDSVISEQSKRPDAVYLSIGPEVKQLPKWLEKDMQRGPGRGVLKVLKFSKDLGPGMKLLGGLREELAAGNTDTLIVYGDDDQLYGPDLLRFHVERHRCAPEGQRKAFGARAIRAGKPEISLLEATGTISIFTGAIPAEVFDIGNSPDQCKFSDDYFFARALNRAGVQFEVMGECAMDWKTGKMSPSCVRGGLHDVAQIHALSAMQLSSGKKSFNGDWRSQLRRYDECGRALYK